MDGRFDAAFQRDFGQSRPEFDLVDDPKTQTARLEYSARF